MPEPNQPMETDPEDTEPPSRMAARVAMARMMKDSRARADSIVAEAHGNAETIAAEAAALLQSAKAELLAATVIRKDLEAAGPSRSSAPELVVTPADAEIAHARASANAIITGARL